MTFSPSKKQATGDEIVTTSCCDCVFAEYVGDTQTDCSMGRLEKFRKNGTTVLEAHNEDKEFYVVERFVLHLEIASGRIYYLLFKRPV